MPTIPCCAVIGRCVSAVWPSVCEAEVAAAVQRGWRPDRWGSYCRRCGASCGPGEATRRGCRVCVGRALPWRGVVRLGSYAEPLNRWVVGMKFAGLWGWGRWMGNELADALPGEGGGAQRLVCPVPMHWSRRLYRGYNQAHLMAAAFAGATGWPLVPLLRRTRRTPPQTSVEPHRRADNARRSVACLPADLTGWTVWLIDDVKTTGATLGECARCLGRAGAAEVRVAVAAVADA